MDTTRHNRLAALHRRALALEEGVLAELGLTLSTATGTRAPAYLRAREQIRQHPALWAQWTRAEALRWKIALSVQDMMRHHVRRHREYADDVAGEVLPYLFHAAIAWDPARAKFTTYAKGWIRVGAQRGALRTRDAVTLSRTAQDLRARAYVYDADEVLADARERRINEGTALAIRCHQVMSLDQPLGSERDAPTLLDQLASPDPGPDEVSAERCDAELLREALARLEQAQPKTVRVLRLRYGLDDGVELDNVGVGRDVGLSRERVRQIVAAGHAHIAALIDGPPALDDVPCRDRAALRRRHEVRADRRARLSVPA